MLMDALGAWEQDLHTCGRPQSESLRVLDQPEPDYVVATRICLACLELDKWRASLKDTLEKAHEEGRHPETYTLPSVYTRDEAVKLAALQERRGEHAVGEW